MFGVVCYLSATMFYEIFRMHVLRTIEDVTSISWIFVLFACFIALIEVGHYSKCITILVTIVAPNHNVWEAFSHYYIRSYILPIHCHLVDNHWCRLLPPLIKLQKKLHCKNRNGNFNSYQRTHKNAPRHCISNWTIVMKFFI